MVLVALVLLGLAARVSLYLLGPSYGYDEAYLLLNVFAHPAGELLGPLQDDQAAPPLFLLALRGLYLVGGGAEWLMRLPAFLATLAALALMMPLARMVVGRPGWPWAAGLAAVCHHAMAHGCQVKPYAMDLLISEAILLAAALALLPDLAQRLHRTGLAALIVFAVVGPWASYPSVFLLGGAAAALLVQRRHRAGLSVGIAAVLSALGLWLFVGRHQHNTSLTQWWSSAFVDLSSPLRTLRWTLGYLVEIGHYGATGLGVPLLVLAVPGWVMLGRRLPALFMLTAMPLAMAWAAGAARAYPLSDRLLFFAAPCVWLPAAAGVGWLLFQLRRAAARGKVRWATFGWLAAAGGLFLPGAGRMAKELIAGPVVPEFREAFARVLKERLPEDHVWVSHPQVFEIYHGRPNWLLGAYTPLEEVATAARRGRLWMIHTPQGPGMTQFSELFDRLRACGANRVMDEHLACLEIVRYEPAPP